ncbi:serine hydrolase domain-containing protein [Paenibacillus wynnii]|uniref:serine hydrolase domain-containing protein n=1 Tax=Paenibacillus wynnii TaxID=268407 RepID=UPI00068D2B7E|nr:serine hydrolase [Paenibacillus wynnii]
MLPGEIESTLTQIAIDNRFNGVVSATCNEQEIVKGAFGYANRADNVLNTPDTRFGIASGCKLFTAIATCQLVEQGKMSFDSKIAECLAEVAITHFSSEITIHHLLTHTSGIPDYFDEDIMEDFEELWITQPMYGLRRLEHFLPLFQNSKMKFSPGERFHYNNAGYILLGLIIEKFSGMEFSDYVEKYVFQPCKMERSGYFSLDQLPSNTAQGYIEHDDGSWRSNIYSIPVKGGSDGGAFVTAPEMLLFWEGLFAYKLLSPELTALLLTPHIYVKKEEYYGYGVWISKREQKILKFHVMGYDPGVSFHSAIYPDYDVKLAVTCNTGRGAYKIMNAIEEGLIN